jgi:hypothetical protein
VKAFALYVLYGRGKLSNGIVGRIVIHVTARSFEKRTVQTVAHCRIEGGTAMLKIVTVTLAFAVLFFAQVRLLPQASEAEACSYDCVVSP